MSPEQYRNRPSYLKLIEHTWNTTVHSTMGVSPFEAAHGLPAASAVISIADDGDYCSPDSMDQAVITAMQTTDRAMEQILKQQQQQEARDRAALVNAKGFYHNLKKGDKVSFFIPPTTREAERLGSKAKHIVYFKGPAIIKEHLSTTTFLIKYNRRTYARCLLELRPYRSDGLPNLVSVANNVGTDLKINNFVTLSDTDDPNDGNFNKIHVGKIVNIADGQVHIQNYVTHSADMTRAKWAPLCQLPSGVYIHYGQTQARDQKVTRYMHRCGGRE